MIIRIPILVQTIIILTFILIIIGIIIVTIIIRVTTIIGCLGRKIKGKDTMGVCASPMCLWSTDW